jgi:hypothetical protein
MTSAFVNMLCGVGRFSILMNTNFHLHGLWLLGRFFVAFV